MLLVGFKDGTIHMYSLEKQKLLRSFYGHIDEVSDSQFSLDGKLIISASLDKSLRVWAPKTAEQMLKMEGYNFHQDGILCFVQHPSQKLVISGSMDNICCLSNYETGEIYKKTEKLSNPINSLAISEAFKSFLISTLDGYLCLIDFSTFKTIFEIKIDVRLLVMFELVSYSIGWIY